MNRNEKAGPGAGTPQTDLNTEPIAASVINSGGKYTTSEKHEQGVIAALLGHGREAAIPAARLAELACYTSIRQLKHEIEAERIAGALILSSSGGYYLPDLDPDKGRCEIRSYVVTLRRRAFSILRNLRAARIAAAVDPDQEALVDESQ